MKEMVILDEHTIQNKIYTLRGLQVMLDRDLAELYGVEPKRLNEQVKRNINRFPEHFRFQLTQIERDELVANCDRFQTLKHSTYSPIEIKEFSASHDRFLILDEEEIYHIGASLKDLGKKWFAFSKFEKGSVEMLGRLNV